MKKIRLNTKLVSSLSNVLFIPAAEIIVASKISNTTYYRIMQTPVTISIQQLLGIANGLHIPVRRFFSVGDADIIGKYEDYVIEPYQPCHYDENEMRRLVDSRPDATWKKAAKATGMSYSRLRNSLMAITRTPVMRFLTVCDTFGVDPFTILVDPNPEPKQNQKHRRKHEESDEIRTLREDLRRLSATIDELTEKYKALMEAHQALANRINVNIGTINGRNIGIAAEPLESR
jgi:hypothetical protein